MLDESRQGIVEELKEPIGNGPMKAKIGGKVVNIWPTVFTGEGDEQTENPVIAVVRRAAQTGEVINVLGLSKPNSRGGSSFYAYEVGEAGASVSPLHPSGKQSNDFQQALSTWSNVLTATIATVEALAAGLDIDDEAFWQKVVRVMVRTQSIAETDQNEKPGGW